MCTRQESAQAAEPGLATACAGARRCTHNGAQTIALVSRARREMLLAVHRHRLSREDLEDCYSQATLELLTHVERGGVFASRAHVANALEQRLLSRVYDRRRALNGRSPIEAAIAKAMPLAGCEDAGIEIPDARADVERLTMLRHELVRIRDACKQLSGDQRLVLASQLAGEAGCAEFCAAYGWSAEKYRKVAQRARGRLARLLSAEMSCPVPVGQSD